MGHNITAILIATDFDAARAAELDLRPVALTTALTMFPIDHYFTAYWQSVRQETSFLDVPEDFPIVFPREGVVRTMVNEVTSTSSPTFAVVMTDYFGGAGGQWAAVFTGANRATSSQASINEALRALGVRRQAPMDEFDTVGLVHHRHAPEYLERYRDLCDERGV